MLHSQAFVRSAIPSMPTLQMASFAPSALSEIIREVQQENAKETKSELNILTDKKQEDVEEKETKVRQTNFEQCWSCEKRVGIRGYKCDCEYVFCNKH